MLDAETQSRGEQTRAGILQAAYELFLANGYHGTSMRQIAQRTGIALGGIYNHFSSKEDIFTAVIMANHPVNQILPALYRAGGDSAENILRSAAQLMAAEVYRRPEFLNLFFSEIVEFRGRHIPDILSAFLPRIMEFASRLSPHQPELRPIPTPALVRVFITMILAYILTEKFFGSGIPEEFRQISLEHYLDVFLHGVLRKEEEHA